MIDSCNDSSGYFSFTLALLVQLALLHVPARVMSRRPVTRGPLWITALAAAGAMALLLVGVLLSIWDIQYSVYRVAPRDVPNYRAALALVLVLASWVGWAVYFHRATRTNASRGVSQRLVRCLWAGSALELLVAVPCHVVARRQSQCCAGMATAYGLAFGLSVMLFSFGPSVYFLFAERWRRLHPDLQGR